MVNKIAAQEFDMAKNSKLAVVDFSATWCGPCQALAPIFDEVAQEMEGSAEFYNVDIDGSRDLAMQYKVMSVPTILVFKDGEKVDQQVGALPKEELKQFIAKHF